MYENGVNHDSVLFLYCMLEAGNNLYVVCVQWIQEAGLLPLCSGPWLRGSTPSSSNASPLTSRKKLLANPSYSEAHRQDITHKCSNVLCVCFLPLNTCWLQMQQINTKHLHFFQCWNARPELHLKLEAHTASKLSAALLSSTEFIKVPLKKGLKGSHPSWFLNSNKNMLTSNNIISEMGLHLENDGLQSFRLKRL